MNLFASSATNLPEFPTFLHYLKQHPMLEKWAHLIVLWEDVIFSSLVAILISLFFYFGAKKREMIPHGLQNFLELVVENIRKLLSSVLQSDADQHFSFLATIFVYIFAMNIFGLIPFLKSPSSSLSISIGVALCVFTRVQYLNVKNMGLWTYFHHMCGSPKNVTGWIISPLMLPIEIITQISRPITLALRLTGNMMGEHTLISISALFAVAVFSFDQLPFGLPIQVPTMLFGMLTSLMQALVFTLLSAVYILLSTPHTSDKQLT